MEGVDLSKLYEKQISLSEWFEAAGHPDVAALRREDNEKRDRLKILSETIAIPFDIPVQFPARDIAKPTLEFKTFLEKRGHQACALRLIPIDPALPKLRTRGKKVIDAVAWFFEQTVDPEKYKADFLPHPTDHLWSTIFVVNQYAIFGEIISGGHYQLTQGFHMEAEPIVFSYDFSEWQTTSDNPAALLHIKEIVQTLRVENTDTQQQLKKALNATFAQNYLIGYFETVTSKEFGLWFIDYNRLLGERYKDISFSLAAGSESSEVIRGQAASPGKATGNVWILSSGIPPSFEDGEILVCSMTTPAELPLMRRAGAIVTDAGGILSHAAIVARELGIPCVIGTKRATQTFRNGDLVEVDADRGTVRRIDR